MSSATTSVSSTYTAPSGLTGTQYTYTFHTDDEQDANNGPYKRFVQVVLTAGSGGGISSATCGARCPARTYFIGFAGSYFRDLKVSSSAVASRHPRLIMVVIDRSASMLQPGGGAFGLASGVVTFLNFFDTTSDSIGIVSFSSNARLEMPLTTNFLIAGTNVLYNTYTSVSATGTQAKGNGNGAGNGNGNGQHVVYTSDYAIPGVDPEQISNPTTYAADGGVRRMKFGGQTAADEGMRLAMEQLMANSGFSNPDILKYIVLFTDGAWNAARTLVAAPGYTNIISCPTAVANGANKNVVISGTTNNPGIVTNSAFWYTANVYFPVPTLSPNTNIGTGLSTATNNFFFEPNDHTNDTWLSIDASNTVEPLPSGGGGQLVGAPKTITAVTYVGTNSAGTSVYTKSLNVWLQPGAVAYVYKANGQLDSTQGPFVSDYTNPTQTQAVELADGGQCVLVVPGYMIDGVLFDGLDLTYEDDSGDTPPYPQYRLDNFNMPYMWPDDTNSILPAYSSSSYPYYAYTGQPATMLRSSKMRELMFRNYANLLTGFTVSRPDDPSGTFQDPYITDSDFARPLNGLGPHYPNADMYWPFNLVGIDWDATYCLADPLYDPEVSQNPAWSGPSTGIARHSNYTVNLLDPFANPEWSGELFYRGTNAALSGTSSASSILTSKADWQLGAATTCPWVITDFDNTTCTTNEPAHNTNITPNPSVWRPRAFNGYDIYTTNGDLVGTGNSGLNGVSQTTDSAANKTGGYVSDGVTPASKTGYYRNVMAWSGRPTHYYDFSQSKWVPIASNHVQNVQILPLCNWKVKEYAWHARALGVTIYAMGYGGLVSQDEQVLLAQVANSTNTTAGGGSNMPYNSAQPIGGQYYATNSAGISNAFYQAASAIAAALTQ